MRNKLSDLKNYLFEALEEVQTAEDPKELDIAIKKSKSISSISSQIIDIANVELNAAKIQLEYGNGKIVPNGDLVLIGDSDE